MTSQTGVWYEPQTDPQLQKVLFPVGRFALPTQEAAWRWRASSITKVGKNEVSFSSWWLPFGMSQFEIPQKCYFNLYLLTCMFVFG